VTGHIDSRISDVMNASADAPGADDDASGVAVVIEAARILSRYRFPATIVYGVLSGEEQGLFGGKLLADYAKAQGWRVEADLNNDIVGAIRGQNGVVDNTRLRVFSEGTRDTEAAQDAKQRRFEGGENDSASRNVARYAKTTSGRAHGGRRGIRRHHRPCRFRLSRQGHRHECARCRIDGLSAATARKRHDCRCGDAGHAAFVDYRARIAGGGLPCSLARDDFAGLDAFAGCRKHRDAHADEYVDRRLRFWRRERFRRGLREPGGFPGRGGSVLGA
jgi:hypothetical protein